MSIESTVGTRIFELRDYVKESAVPVLIEALKEINLSLNAQQKYFLKQKLETSINISFDRGMNNILSVVKGK
ncbi:hypothetical protein CL614_09475 [archaeon]|nr:hypothetical protein [archaeon]|tara:strand:- start:635 stop:850 length:216 start_codon:yes stop_codon:yes gene_type:complete